MKKLYITILVLAAIAVLVWVYFKYAKPIAPPPPPPEESIGGTLFEAVSPENPAENLPELNPFEAGVNPYADGYKNPFAE